MLDDLGDAADVGGDDGDFAGHGFESGEAERLELGRKKEKISGGELFVDIVLLAEEEDVFLEAVFADEEFGGTAVRAVTDENKLGGHFGANEREDFDGVSDALDGAEIRKMHEDGFAVGSPFGGEPFVGRAIVEFAVHEIGDDFDGALDVEVFDRFAEKILGDGGDAVALLDGEFCDGKIATVAADERDIRAVKSGDEGEAARGGHGAREHGADGVRNRVMDVKKIERFGFEDFEHFCGESESVGRMVEERVGGDFDLVEVDARVVGVHPNGRSVADEMDVMAASG